jgi:NADH-quinone oxidoreductase subunit E
MAVRRLHSEQPASFAFTEANKAWAAATIAKYPSDRKASAVIPLLWRAQEQSGGWLPEPAMRVVAEMLEMPMIRIYEIATFYTMFQLSPVGAKAHVQVCGTTPCMLRGSGDLVAVCKRFIASEPHQLSKDGNFSWEEVECLGSCANAPMVQIGSDTYEDLTAESFLTLLEGFSRGKPPKPGSQTGRQASCPEGGPTTLLGSASSAAVAAGKVAAAPPKDHSTVVSDGRVGSGRAPAPVVVGDEAVGETWRPELLALPRDGRPDDLKLISGIGPMLEKSLNRLGIFHFEQIANWLPPHIKWIDQELEDFRGRAERDKWVEQAKKLASGWRPEGGAAEKSKG